MMTVIALLQYARRFRPGYIFMGYM